MKRKVSTVVLIIASIALLASSSAAQSNTKPDAAQSEAGHSQREMMNAVPGPAHRGLAKLVGDYTTATRFFMQPGAPPSESAGTARISSGLDGRFLKEEDTGSFLGQQMQSFKILGYNNASKRYEGVWTYTMSTGIMTLNGTTADGGKTMTFTGSYDDEGGVRQSLQVIMRLTDENHFEVELSAQQPDGKPGPKLVTTYVRNR